MFFNINNTVLLVHFIRFEILKKMMALLKQGFDLDPLAFRTFVCTFTINDLLSFVSQIPLELCFANLYYHLKSDSRSMKVIAFLFFYFKYFN